MRSQKDRLPPITPLPRFSRHARPGDVVFRTKFERHFAARLTHQTDDRGGNVRLRNRHLD